MTNNNEENKNDEDKIIYWKNQTVPDNNLKFTDSLFPPTEESFTLVNASRDHLNLDFSQFGFKRLSEIFRDEDYDLFFGKIELRDIEQGSLGDCYYLSTLGAICEYPELFIICLRQKG